MVTLRMQCLMAFKVFIYLIAATQAIEPAIQKAQDHLTVISEWPNAVFENSECPDEEAIAPCECSKGFGENLSMDCSNITSEDDLKRVFSQEFPSTTFLSLTIENNHNLKTLRARDLGNVSFEVIFILNVSLSEVEELALAGSYDTLESLQIYTTQLETVLDITPFKKLTFMTYVESALTSFPVLNSPILEKLYLTGNQIPRIPVDAIYGLPSLTNLHLDKNLISEILPRTFTNNKRLESLYFSSNYLTFIGLDTIRLYVDYSGLNLANNQIVHFPAGSIPGVGDYLSVNNNSLTELEEKLFRPILEKQGGLDIQDNPYGCGCDIAWLILNPTLLNRVRDTPACFDGTPFVDLDPDYYQAMCG